MRTLPDDTLPRYPGCDQGSPSQTPAGATATQQETSESVTSSEQQVPEPSPSLYNAEPFLTSADFEFSWSTRSFLTPPQFLQELPDPLHSGWKSLENGGGGSCLFRAAADHIYLKDFRVLRKFVHQHIIDNWFLYRPYFVPLSVTIGSGNTSYRKHIRSEYSYLEFLHSDESMNSFNTSDAEIIAIGNVLKIVKTPT